MENGSEYLTVLETSKILKVHPNTLRLWEKEGVVKSYRLNGKRFLRFKKSDIYNFHTRKTNSKSSLEKKRTHMQLEYLASYPLLNPNPVLGTDGIGNVIYANKGTANVLKQLGEKDAHVFLPSDFTDILTSIRKNKKEKSYYREIHIKDKIFAETIYAAKNMVRIYTTDITERKRAEERIKKLNDTLKRYIAKINKQDKKKDEFIRIASHELKTPLTSVKAYAQLLHNFHIKDKKDKLTAYTSRMINQIYTLEEYVEDLLSVNKIHAGKLALRKIEFDIYDAMIETRDTFRQIHSNRTIEFYSVRQNIHADKARIMQVITILLNNAARYSSSDTDIRMKAIIKDKQLVVSLKDKGIGIAKNEQKKIFSQFYQSETADRGKYGGLGLGLFIAKGIVKQHKGDIWVESSVGKGSTFFFTIPIYTPSV